MNEAEFWSHRIRPLLAPWAFVQRVEDGLNAGTPDVFYCLRDGRAGWLENKFREQPPARAGSLVLVGHRGFSVAQRAWWRLYLHHGGRGFLCVGVGPVNYIWRASDALVIRFNELTWAEYQESGVRLGPGNVREVFYAE